MKNRFAGFEMLPVDFAKLNAMKKATGISFSALIRFYLREGIKAYAKTKAPELRWAVKMSDAMAVEEQIGVTEGPYVMDFPNHPAEIQV